MQRPTTPTRRIAGLLVDDDCPTCAFPEIGALVDFAGEPGAIARYCRRCGWTYGDAEAVVTYCAAVGLTFPPSPRSTESVTS